MVSIPLLYFNSIKVQLEQVGELLPCAVFENFNSIKVQLEHTFVHPDISFTDNFNSIKVQLERPISVCLRSYCYISIP